MYADSQISHIMVVELACKIFMRILSIAQRNTANYMQICAVKQWKILLLKIVLYFVGTFSVFTKPLRYIKSKFT